MRMPTFASGVAGCAANLERYDFATQVALGSCTLDPPEFACSSSASDFCSLNPLLHGRGSFGISIAGCGCSAALFKLLRPHLRDIPRLQLVVITCKVADGFQ